MSCATTKVTLLFVFADGGLGKSFVTLLVRLVLMAALVGSMRLDVLELLVRLLIGWESINNNIKIKKRKEEM